RPYEDERSLAERLARTGQQAVAEVLNLERQPGGDVYAVPMKLGLRYGDAHGRQQHVDLRVYIDRELLSAFMPGKIVHVRYDARHPLAHRRRPAAQPHRDPRRLAREIGPAARSAPPPARAQPLACSTAWRQRARRAARRSAFQVGSKRRSASHWPANSSSPAQKPVARPASPAAPRAVDSDTRGRTTGTPSRSACICISRSLRAAPPSTRSSDSSMPLSAFMQVSSSALCSAMASSVARATCAAVVPRVRPTRVPRAYGSQSGAPRPAKAGTRKTSSVSGTLAASASTWSERWMMPSPS